MVVDIKYSMRDLMRDIDYCAWATKANKAATWVKYGKRYQI